MAQTLEQKVRSAYGLEGDEYFQSDVVVGRINDAQEKTISVLSAVERESGNALRALDKLRYLKHITVDNEVKKENDNFVTNVTTPADLREFLYVGFYDKSLGMEVPVVELSGKRMMMLQVGNAIPSKQQMFYSLVNETEQPNSSIVVYGYEIIKDDDELRVYYIKNPEKVTSTSTSMSSLPDYLEQAVIMDTCSKLAFKDPDQKHNPKEFEAVFELEIKGVL